MLPPPLTTQRRVTSGNGTTTYNATSPGQNTEIITIFNFPRTLDISAVLASERKANFAKVTWTLRPKSMIQT